MMVSRKDENSIQISFISLYNLQLPLASTSNRRMSSRICWRLKMRMGRKHVHADRYTWQSLVVSLLSIQPLQFFPVFHQLRHCGDYWFAMYCLCWTMVPCWQLVHYCHYPVPCRRCCVSLWLWGCFAWQSPILEKDWTTKSTNYEMNSNFQKQSFFFNN